MSSTVITDYKTRQRLHEIVRKDTSFHQKAREALELGKRYLDVDRGYLTRVDQETNHWKIVVTSDTENEQGSHNLGVELQKTYCPETIEDDVLFALHDASNQGWDDDPAFEISDQNAYLEIPVITEDEPYGTVRFVAQDSRSESFTEAEIRFADHLTRLLERELEKKLITGELTNQSNLSTVLHRVLRHNLRNDISIIRGYTERMSERLDDDSVGDTVLAHIDDLIDLTQKARELEEIITTNSDRQSTEIGLLIENIAAEISEEYPAVSVDVDYDTEIYVNVLQNFDRAIEELIENAVKHSSDESTPRVRVAIETVSNGIEIEISDNGPGLPEQEAAVLTSGEETQLTHGSGLGLWLAYWIVSSHDGSIEPEVTEDGTTLTVTLPRKPEVSVQQEVTELTRSRDKYKASFEKASDAIAIVDDDGRITDANEATSAIFGAESDELLGRSVTEFLPTELAFDSEWQEFQETDGQRDTTTIVGADGVERIVEYSAAADITPGQHLFISREITERKERERELEVAETVFNSAQDALFLADIVDDQEYRLNRVNEAFEVITQRSNDNIAGMGPRELLGDDAGAEVQSWFNECVASQEPVEFEQVVPANGESRIWQVRVAPVIQDGEVTQLVGAMRHITERKERERKLTDLKQRYQTLIEAAPDPLFIADPETGEILEVNDAAETLIGMPSDEIIGMDQSEIHPSEQAELYQQLFKEHVDAGGVKRRLPDGSHLTVVTATGDHVPIEVSAATVSLPDGPVTYAIFRDISEQVERERELEATTQRLQLALEGTETGVWDWSIETDNVRWSESLERLVGLEPGTFEGTFDAFVEYVHPDDRQEALNAVERAVDTESRFQTEYRIQREDGTLIWVESRGEIYDEDHESKRMVGIITDITERIESKRQLELAETVFENTQDALFVVDVTEDREFHIERVNEMYEALTGLSNAEIVGKTPPGVVGEEIGSEIESRYRECVERQETIKYPEEIPVDGEQRQWETKVTPVISDGQVDKLIGAMRDVTRV